MLAAHAPPSFTFQPCQLAREIIQAEAVALNQLAGRLDEKFAQTVTAIVRCRGNVIVSGVGKAGLVAQKISATFASTGTRSHFLHPTEAVHGDLGRVDKNDILLVLSFSGETDEILRLVNAAEPMGATLISITGRPLSTLARQSAMVLDLGPIREACPLGLAPSASTAAMLALGDALALVASRMKQFSKEDFARFHPGGSLGRKLSKVDDVLRALGDCRVAHDSQTVREVYIAQGKPGRRTGAIMLIDADGKLSGIFTDSDLARLLERRQDAAIDGPITAVMTRNPSTVTLGTSLGATCDVLAAKKISELPVVDDQGCPVGLIDITDVVGISIPHDIDDAPETPVLRIHEAAADPSAESSVIIKKSAS